VVIILNVHAQAEDSFYAELEHVLNPLPKYHMKICLEILKQK